MVLQNLGPSDQNTFPLLISFILVLKNKEKNYGDFSIDKNHDKKTQERQYMMYMYQEVRFECNELYKILQSIQDLTKQYHHQPHVLPNLE